MARSATGAAGAARFTGTAGVAAIAMTDGSVPNFGLRTSDFGLGLECGPQSIRLERPGAMQTQGTALDLLIRGGTVIDPAEGIHGRRDVGIRDGVIVSV